MNRCERCGRVLRPNDPGDHGLEFDLEICCMDCACELEESADLKAAAQAREGAG